MERCNVTSAETSREKVPWMEGSIWTVCSRVAMRSVQDPVVPQQGRMSRLQQAKGTRNRTSTSTSGSQTLAWPQQGGSPSENSSGEALALATAQALAMARQQLAQARAAAMPEARLGILENEVQQQETAMKQAQSLGQKMDPARARFRRPVGSGGMRCKRCRRPWRVSSKRSRRTCKPRQTWTCSSWKPRCQ